MNLIKGEKTKAYLCELIQGKNIPYLDILVKKEHKTVLRCYDSYEQNATGKENIFLFSCTKPMTVACVLHLVEEGKLSLDDEVSKRYSHKLVNILKPHRPKKVFPLPQDATHRLPS